MPGTVAVKEKMFGTPPASRYVVVASCPVPCEAVTVSDDCGRSTGPKAGRLGKNRLVAVTPNPRTEFQRRRTVGGQLRRAQQMDVGAELGRRIAKVDLARRDRSAAGHNSCRQSRPRFQVQLSSRRFRRR